MGYYDAFLSYDKADREAVLALASRLRDAGLAIFVDAWHVMSGDQWQAAFEEALKKSRTVVILVGPRGLSRWQQAELDFSFSYLVRFGRGRVIPVMLPGADPKDFPNSLRSLTRVDFRRGLDDSEALQRLIWGIQGKTPSETPVDSRPPRRRFSSAWLRLAASAALMTVVVAGWIYAGYQQTALASDLGAEAIAASHRGEQDLAMLLAVEALGRGEGGAALRELITQSQPMNSYDNEELMALACRRAGRNLTREEWRQYLGKRPYHKTCPDLPEPELPVLGPPHVFSDPDAVR